MDRGEGEETETPDINNSFTEFCCEGEGKEKENNSKKRKNIGPREMILC